MIENGCKIEDNISHIQKIGRSPVHAEEAEGVDEHSKSESYFERENIIEEGDPNARRS